MMVQRAAGRAIILSDCAHTGEDGRVTALASKLLVAGLYFPWACAVSGNVALDVLMREMQGSPPTSPRELMLALPSAMRRATVRAAAARGCDPVEVLLQVTGAMWQSDTQRLAGFVVSSASGTLQGQQTDPFAWYETEWLLTLPADSLPAIFGRPVNLADPSSFDPETDGVTLAKAQRAAIRASVTPGAGSACRIGGDLDMTEITPNGVTVWTIHAWPDRIGELIDCHAGN